MILLRHILYAFANVKPDSGEVVLSDVWSDQDIHYDGDDWNETGQNLYGNFKQIALLKRRHRHLKLLLSIGGWTYSPSFHPVVVSSSLRATFVSSAVKLVEDYGLDGLDVDYEYPENAEQAKGYTLLLGELRVALDNLQRHIGGTGRFELTIAAPCGQDKYEKLDIAGMDKHLDFWNLMVRILRASFTTYYSPRYVTITVAIDRHMVGPFLFYHLVRPNRYAVDYAGSWDSKAGHQANVHHGHYSTAKAVNHYAHSVHPSKLVIGMPLYGRSFLATEGPGTPFSGLGQGSWEAGVYDYRALPLPGATVHHDMDIIASWSYDKHKKEMISYDDEKVVRAKAEWILEHGLGGAMYWELSG